MALFSRSVLQPGVRKREVFGWAMYDFANSGYTTVVITAVFAAYFVGGIARSAPWAAFAWTLALSIAYAVVMFTMPAIGAWADRHAAKKRVLALVTAGCVLATAALAFTPRMAQGEGLQGVLFAMLLVVVSNTFYSYGESLTGDGLFFLKYVTEGARRMQALVSDLLHYTMLSEESVPLEQVGLFVDKRFPWPELARLQHGHLSLAQVRPFLGEEAFGAYFKFAFVRNPFDRFVSYCAFATRDSGDFGRDPRAVMHHVLFRLRPMQHLLFQPQHRLLVDADGRLLADEVGRVETMQASYDALCARIGIPSAVLDKVNSSRRGDYRDYYDQALVDGVADLYRRDLELFGYDF